MTQKENTQELSVGRKQVDRFNRDLARMSTRGPALLHAFRHASNAATGPHDRDALARVVSKTLTMSDWTRAYLNQMEDEYGVVRDVLNTLSQRRYPNKQGQASIRPEFSDASNPDADSLMQALEDTNRTRSILLSSLLNTPSSVLAVVDHILGNQDARSWGLMRLSKLRQTLHPLMTGDLSSAQQRTQCTVDAQFQMLTHANTTTNQADLLVGLGRDLTILENSLDHHWSEMATRVSRLCTLLDTQTGA